MLLEILCQYCPGVLTKWLLPGRSLSLPTPQSLAGRRWYRNKQRRADAALLCDCSSSLQPSAFLPAEGFSTRSHPWTGAPAGAMRDCKGMNFCSQCWVPEKDAFRMKGEKQKLCMKTDVCRRRTSLGHRAGPKQAEIKRCLFLVR